MILRLILLLTLCGNVAGDELPIDSSKMSMKGLTPYYKTVVVKDSVLHDRVWMEQQIRDLRRVVDSMRSHPCNLVNLDVIPHPYKQGHDTAIFSPAAVPPGDSVLVPLVNPDNVPTPCVCPICGRCMPYDLRAISDGDGWYGYKGELRNREGNDYLCRTYPDSCFTRARAGLKPGQVAVWSRWEKKR
jgi:hypothetical protein